MNGTNPLLSKEENTAQMIEPPTEEEMNQAITGNFGRLMTVMKAVKNFKRLVDPTKTAPAMQSILGGDAQFVAPPMEMDESEDFPSVGLDPNAHSHSSHGLNAGVRKFWGRHREDSGATGTSDSASFSFRPEHSPASSRLPSGVFEPERKDSGSVRSGRSPGKVDERPHSQSGSIPLSRASSATTKRSIEGTRGHARDPLEEDWPYLFIGPSTYTGTSPQTETNTKESLLIFAEPETTEDDPTQVSEPMPIVSESPGAADFDIYETAYSQELERIKSNLLTQTAPGAGPKVYLTRRVEGKDEVMKFVKDKTLNLQVGQKKVSSPSPVRGPSTAFGAAVSMLRNQIQQQKEQAEREELSEAEVEQPQQRSEDCGERRPAQPLSSQPITAEPSSLEATGVPASEGAGNSTAQLRRLLGMVKEKGG
ncbi:hypothetical protein N7532_007389 [Penicillium argentinense]|uniref:Uncharacterized protein n=1 Tax=Penicillium argentinense TaxID=1131581 RepID=A0A9W9K6L9_9EURO|nr:uncharacterized protein N7532_007389 [Penicillium argentinense]KAJ5095098.1 hypothetical protein N7532_007389 [Penicillium argentinense]